MKRMLFTMVSVMSLVLCLALAALWVRSYWVNDEIDLDTRAINDTLQSSRGELNFTSEGRLSKKPRGLVHRSLWPNSLHDAALGLPWHTGVPGVFGLGIWQSGGAEDTYYSAVLSDWVLLLAFSFFPVVWLRRRIKTARLHRVARCPTCGYDLRASTGRCPECGTAVPKKTEMSI